MLAEHAPITLPTLIAAITGIGLPVLGGFIFLGRKVRDVDTLARTSDRTVAKVEIMRSDMGDMKVQGVKTSVMVKEIRDRFERLEGHIQQCDARVEDRFRMIDDKITRLLERGAGPAG